MKNEQEIQFEQMVLTLDQEFTILEDRRTQAKINESRIEEFSKKIKKLNTVLKRVQEKLKSQMRKANSNQYDIKNRIRNHYLTLDKINDRFKALEVQNFQEKKRKLMQNRSLNAEEKQYLKRMEDHKNRAQNLYREGHEVHGIVVDTYGELHAQRRQLEGIDGDVKGFDEDLTMTQQLFRVIKNRELVTKLILILLVVGLGFADFMILLIKFI